MKYSFHVLLFSVVIAVLFGQHILIAQENTQPSLESRVAVLESKVANLESQKKSLWSCSSQCGGFNNYSAYDASQPGGHTVVGIGATSHEAFADMESKCSQTLFSGIQIVYIGSGTPARRVVDASIINSCVKN
ncbi:MAG: hypothetical protein HYY62_09765 [Deltaproteobacteria bacterium]|nr:hypothetical protein [Deltaproteobacteria bacterium]